jgi:gas vesicle protein
MRTHKEKEGVPMSKSTDTALAFLLGAVAGGAIALLLAPEKGEVTRRKIREGAGDIYGKGKSFTTETGQRTKEKAVEASEWVKEKASDAAASARTQVEAVKSAVAEGKEAYRRELEKS